MFIPLSRSFLFGCFDIAYSTDEDKLSAYFRFSEGEDENKSWREQGFFSDITKFDNKAIVVGGNDSITLEESTSSVDEGESGKVKALYDLVFKQSGVGNKSALVIPSPRGGSLDLGLMHGPNHMSRKKCTMEFWIWIPQESIEKEIILVRRTFGTSADDFHTVCNASNKSSVLYELALKKNGELEFRTTGKKPTIKTKPKEKTDEDNDDDPTSTIHFSRWNHICITMKQESITKSSISLFVRGVKKAHVDSFEFSPIGFKVNDVSEASGLLDTNLEKSHLIYGIDHPKGFRMTEIRIWALERKEDDINALMREYLVCAEIKRKFKVKIKKKFGIDATSNKISLAPPKETPLGGLKPPNEGKRRFESKKVDLLSSPKEKGEERSINSHWSPQKGTIFSSNFSNSFGGSEESPTAGNADTTTPISFGSDGFAGRMSDSTSGSDLHGEKLLLASPDSRTGDSPIREGSNEVMYEVESEHVINEEEPIEISPLWDSAIPLSEQVRSSAAAALIRGPPATRHFGGNRGGLPDYRELERFGVGAISICGSEKTIVWRDDQVPPGLTYPIGASGAIVRCG